MSDRGYEYTAIVPKMYLPPDNTEPTVLIHISKVGGGTLGESYTGYWSWSLEVGGVLIEGDDTLSCGMPHTHDEMARECAGFLASGRDESDPLYDRLTSFESPDED